MRKRILSVSKKCFFSSSSTNSTNANPNSSHLNLSNANPTHSSSANTTHFGYKTVFKEEKQSLVNQVFGRVANSYDVMNDAMSLGIHRLWKDYFVSRLNPPILMISEESQGDSSSFNSSSSSSSSLSSSSSSSSHNSSSSFKVLDVAGGTGDIAFRILQYNPNVILPFSKPPRTSTNVTVLDINPEMLRVGQLKADSLIKAGAFAPTQISFKEGNAESLTDLADNSFDAYTIAFGIRNCTNIAKVVAEAHRVLKPGGRFLCLEFSHVDNPVASALYDTFSFGVIPKLGKLIANDEDSYVYLVESIRKFPKQPEFAKIIMQAGFKQVTYENLSLGVVSIHSGFKL